MTKTKTQKNQARAMRIVKAKGKVLQKLWADGKIKHVKGDNLLAKSSQKALNRKQMAVMYLKTKDNLKLRKSTPMGVKIYTRKQFYAGFRAVKSLVGSKQVYNYM